MTYFGSSVLLSVTLSFWGLILEGPRELLYRHSKDSRFGQWLWCMAVWNTSNDSKGSPTFWVTVNTDRRKKKTLNSIKGVTTKIYKFFYFTPNTYSGEFS